MFWHVKYRKTMAQHKDHWFTNTDEQLMAEYIARNLNQLPLQELEDIKNTCEYGCSDPRTHPRHQEHSEDAARKQKGELMTISTVWQRYWNVMCKIMGYYPTV